MRLIPLCMALLALGSSAASAQDAATIRGAGATFPAAAYTAWSFGYSKEKKVPMVYQGVGSGEGVKRIVAREVDFGASDDPMSAADLEKYGLIQFPTLVGAQVPAYNLANVKPGELRLTGAVLAKIFSGQIRMWNDPELVALNRSLTLAAKPIRRIVREDSSGSTRTFASYLARYNTNWEKRYGVGFKVDWPGEVLTARGTKAMAELIKATEGSIGYTSHLEVAGLSLAAPQLQNRSGNFVLPTQRAMLAAVNASGMARSGEETASLLDMAAPEAWPLTDTSYVLLPRVMADAQRAKKVLNFFYWVFAQGDKMAADSGFVPLPTRVQVRVLSRFREVSGPDGRPIEYLSQRPIMLAQAC